MSLSTIPPRQTHDLDFLKSIVGDEQSSISRIDEVSEDIESGSHTSKSNYYYQEQPFSRPKTSHGGRGQNSSNSKDHASTNNDTFYSDNSDSEVKSNDSHVRLSLTPVSAQKDEKDSTHNKRKNEKITVRVVERKKKEEVHGDLGSTREYKPLSRKKRPVSAANQKSKVQDPGAYRLEQKYLELKTLIQGAKPEVGGNRLLHAVSRMAQNYHMEAYGLRQKASTLYGYSPRSSRVLEQLGIDGLICSPRRPTSAKPANTLYSSRSENDQDSYILIDGTGPNVKTRRVLVSPPESETCDPVQERIHMPPQPPLPTQGKNGRSRALTRRPPAGKKKAWGGSRTNSEVSQKPTSKRRSPRSPSYSRSSRSRSRSSARSRSSSRRRSTSKGKKSKQRSRSSSSVSYSDSFDSESSSRSRSRSPSKTVDLHLKYTKNEKLQTWLKEKDKLHREQKRKERKERREKRKLKQVEAEEKEKLRQKSDVVVEKWMRKKSAELRLLKREQQTSPKVGLKKEDDSLIVIDETLDLKDYGARIDPEKVPKAPPKKESDKKNDTEMRDKPSRVIPKRAPENKNEIERKALLKKESRNRSHDVEKKDEEKESNNKETYEDKQDANDEPSTYPRPSSALPPKKKNLKTRKQRPHSGVMTHSRPANKQQSRFADGAKDQAKDFKEKISKEKEEEEKKRKSYNEFLKANRKTKKKEKEKKNEEQEENEGQQMERLPGVGAEKEEKEAHSGEEGEKEESDVERKDDSDGSDSEDASENEVNGREPSSVKATHNAEDENGAYTSQKDDINESEKKSENDKSDGFESDSGKVNEDPQNPRPKTPRSNAYESVKHEQQSWDKFGDFVWKEVNKEAEEQGGETTKQDEEDERKVHSEQLTSSVKEVSWADDEQCSNKVMMDGGENDISPPLWQTDDMKRSKTEEEKDNDLSRKEESEEEPDPLAEIQKSDTFLTATE